MADVARLGLIVDATGAKREIKLTTDELKKLADGGKLAAATLRQIGDPATTSRITAGANAMAAQVKVLDPFQRTAAQATFEVGKLRQGMTSLAVAAGALPGPLGRVASSLAPLAIGGGVTVGVLAGITAITFAWQKFREEAEKSAQMMAKLREGETSMAPGAMRARLSLLDQQEADLSDLVTGRRKGRTPAENDPSAWAGNRRRADLEELRRRRNELSIALRRADGQAAAKSGGDVSYPRGWDTEDVFSRDLAGGFSLGRHVDQGLAGMRPPGELPVEMDPMLMASIADSVTESLRKHREAVQADASALTQHQQNLRSAVKGVAQFALATAASRFGPSTGASVIAQAAGGVLSGTGGGAPGMIAGGIIGLAGGLFGLSDAAKENRRQIEREAALRQQLNEQLRTSLRNAPSGFFAEGYFQGAAGAGPPGGGPGPGSGTPRPLSSVAASSVTSITLVMPAGSIVIQGNRSDIEMARSMVRGVRQLASANGGAGLMLAEALERIN